MRRSVARYLPEAASKPGRKTPPCRLLGSGRARQLYGDWLLHALSRLNQARFPPDGRNKAASQLPTSRSRPHWPLSEGLAI